MSRDRHRSIEIKRKTERGEREWGRYIEGGDRGREIERC